MNYILDTNVLSELRKLNKAHAAVRRWVAKVDMRDFYLSAITLYELQLGILQLARRDRDHAAMLTSWLDTRVMPAFANRVLPVDAAVALRCAVLHVPDPRSLRDSIIAATAMVHGMTVVTRNVEDFQDTGARLLNPWEM